MSFGDGVERPRTALAEHPAFSHLVDPRSQASSWLAPYLEYHGKLFEIMLARLEQVSTLDRGRGNLAERGDCNRCC
jgi:hypothetical protein